MFICYVACSLNLVTVLSIWLSVLSDASSFISSIICCRHRHRLTVSPCSVYWRCQSSMLPPANGCNDLLCASPAISWIHTGKHRQDLVCLHEAGSRKTCLTSDQSQPHPWTVHSTHSTEGESPGYCGPDNPDFSQQLIFLEAAIKTSTTWLGHLKER